MLAIPASLIPVKYVVTNMHTPRLVLHLEREKGERGEGGEREEREKRERGERRSRIM